ncbi:hypothetical protein [Glycomyces tarimensis]
MVHVSVRQNRPGGTEQNTFERHSRGPGSPLVEVPGDGFYDWAGRRLFLPDGRPDPNTPGAYRYQHDPECTDRTAPESDPANPRYEPPHLRHRPGDTWEIGGKPHDPEDSGPYGASGWYQDRRTGRHRRGELPDPLPPERDRPGPAPRGHRRHLPEPASDHRAEEPYRFSRLREDAWDRWLIDSEPLARAHIRRPEPERASGRLIAALIRFARWTAALCSGSHHAEAAPAQAAPETESPLSLRGTPANPPLPRPRAGYIDSWERAFDARRPVAGGGLA